MTPYKIVYSRRKRMSITVKNDNQVIVRAPFKTDGDKIADFVLKNQNWINKYVSRNLERIQRDQDVLNFKAVYLDGRQVPLILGEKNSVTPTCVYLKRVEDIQKMFIKSFSEQFIEEVNYIASKIGLIPNSVKVKNYKSRWGCCSSNGDICFNYKLFMTPEKFRDYVIIHELCHLKHHNHSSAFWNLVKSYIPNYKECRSERVNFDFLLSLY